MDNNQTPTPVITSQIPPSPAPANMGGNGGMPPVMNMAPAPTPTPKKSEIGAVIATIVIIAIIILGGLYFWGKRIELQKENQALLQNGNTTSDETAAATEATKIETVSQDDSLNTIQAESKTTQTTNLSPELQ